MVLENHGRTTSLLENAPEMNGAVELREIGFGTRLEAV
jgi:hypothetical protein